MAVELIVIDVPDVNHQMDDLGYTEVILYRASSYAGTYNSIDSEPLVEDTTRYEFTDSSGTTASWYKYRFYDGVSEYSDYSKPWPAQNQPAYSGLQIVRRVAGRLTLHGMPKGDVAYDAPSGTTTAAGTTTTVVCTSYADSLWPDRAFKAWHLRLNGGTYAGQERGVSSLTTSTGTFTVSRAFGGASGSSVEFDLFGMTGAMTWLGFVNERLKDIWTAFSQPVTGDDADDRRTVYALPSFITARDQILRVVRRTGTTHDGYTLTPGQDFWFREVEGGGLEMYTGSPLGENDVYYVEGKRHPDDFGALDDQLILNEDQIDALTYAAAHEAAFHFSTQLGGVVEDRREWADRAEVLRRKAAAAIKDANRWVSTGIPWREPMVPIDGSGFRRSSGRSAYY